MELDFLTTGSHLSLGFTVPADGHLQFSGDAEGLKEYIFTETSPTTYQLTLICVAGAVSADEDETYVYMEDALLTALTVSVSYNESVVIEYDGSSFRQV